MKAASIKEIKKALEDLPEQELLPILLRLTKFKKENKELITYLVFESADESAYVQSITDAIDVQFHDINHSSLYFVKKSLRKILRMINRFSKYSNQTQTMVELLIYFCKKVKLAGIPVHKSSALINLYSGQIKKISKEIKTLHEDLQYDYLKELKTIE